MSSTSMTADAAADLATDNSTMSSHHQVDNQVTAVPEACDNSPPQESSPEPTTPLSPSKSKKNIGAKKSSNLIPALAKEANATNMKAKASMAPPAKPSQARKAGSSDSPDGNTTAAPSSTRKKGVKRSAEEEVAAIALKRKKAAQTQTMRPSRRMPTFQGGPGLAVDTGDDGELQDFMNFNATIFEVHLGASDFKFHVHENFLKKSPTLVEKVKEAKQKPRRADNQILYLDEHDPGAFEQAVQYLYMDKFKLIKQNTNLGRLRELHELMALAKILQLRPLQKQIVATFAKSNLINKISIWTFFDWAEDMYYEEIDFQKGPFQKYFAHNAPDLLKNSFLGRERIVQGQVVDEPPHELRDKIMLQVKTGGAYAMEIFSIMHDALCSFKTKIELKNDEPSAQSLADRKRVQPEESNEEQGLFVDPA